MVTSRITRVPAGSDTTTPSESRIHAGSSVVERVLLPGSDGAEPAGLRGSDGVQDSYVVLMVNGDFLVLMVNGDFLVLMVNQDYYLVLMVTSTRITWFRYPL